MWNMLRRGFSYLAAKTAPDAYGEALTAKQRLAQLFWIVLAILLLTVGHALVPSAPPAFCGHECDRYANGQGTK